MKPPAISQLDAEMIEFFQRSVAQNVATGKPAPFEVQESVQQFDTVMLKQDEVLKQPQVPAQAVLNAPRPGITEIFGNNGGINGGTSRTIHGSGFIQGCVVFFGTHEATDVTFIDSDYISCTVPASTTGHNVAVDVIVYNVRDNEATKSTLTHGFTYYHVPGIVSITPNSGPGAGGTSLSINTTFMGYVGCWFSFGGATVFGTRTGFWGTVGDATYECTTPVHANGAVDVEVISPDYEHQRGTLVGGYTYGVPGPVPGPYPDYFVLEAFPLTFLRAGIIYNWIMRAYKNGVVDTTFNGQMSFIYNPGGFTGGLNAYIEWFPHPINFSNGQASFQIRPGIIDYHTDGSIYIALADAHGYYQNYMYWPVLR